MAGSTIVAAAAAVSSAASAAKATTTAKAATKKKVDVNVTVAKYYAAALCGMIAVFIIIHWTRIIYKKLGPKQGSKSIFSPIVSLTRRVRKFLFRSVPFVPSAGYGVVISTYFALQIILSCVRIADYNDLELWGERFGWMCAANMVFLVFLAMRNTPLGFLTGYTYERLQVLHRTAGYTTIVYMILHTFTYVPDWVMSGKGAKLIAKNIVMGIIAGVCMFVLFLCAVLLRRRQYELFYLSHIVLFIPIIITTFLHRPTWRRTLPQATLFAACLFLLDRFIRWFRMAYNAVNNSATLTTVPGDDENGDATRIVLKKPLFAARPGQHCLVWIPRIRLFESHPFTIVANGPGGLELVATATGKRSFTRALHNFTKSNSSNTPLSVWASVDGPYGIFPDLHSFDRIILVAGGSGATFTFGLATHLVENLKPDSQQKVDFIWAVRKNERIAWFESHIDTLISHDAHVQLTVHVTNDTPPIGSDPSSEKEHVREMTTSTSSPIDIEKQHHIQTHHHRTSITSSSDDDQEDASASSPTATTPTASLFGIKDVRYEKLRVAESIERIVSTIPNDQRVLIAACGPTPLMDNVRTAAAHCIRTDGPSVDLHYENFSW